MRILGIDPGLNITGYGVVEKDNKGIKIIEAGTVSTSYKQGLPTRLNIIYSQLKDLIKFIKLILKINKNWPLCLQS